MPGSFSTSLPLRHGRRERIVVPIADGSREAIAAAAAELTNALVARRKERAAKVVRQSFRKKKVPKG